MIINLTPHPIHFVNDAGNVYRTITPTAPPARCNTGSVKAGWYDGIPLTVTAYGDLQDLPPQAEDTMYIVSLLVRQAVPERNDLASPGTIVRDSEGKIIGCKTLDVN